ncbi:hypothetical protein J2847_004209 [Azospirillum agricola]|nr:hypothetical protein [Azospirillum agricola]
MREILTGRHRDLRAAAKLAVAPVDGTGQEAQAPQPDQDGKPPPRREQRGAAIQAARHARFEEVVALDACGWSQIRIAQTLGLDRKTVRAWLLATDGTAMAGFAGGLKRDPAAVRAALSLLWSTGPVEGQISSLKTIRRTMNGRGGFDLLRQRVLEAACMVPFTLTPCTENADGPI